MSTGNTGARGDTGDTGPTGPTGSSVWSSNNNNIFYNNGFVGINTTTPSYFLDVSGNVNVVGLVNANTINIIDSVVTNTSYGYNSLNQGDSGSDNNTAVGYQSLSSNTTGSNNTAVGYQSLNSNTTGSYNSSIGTYALYNNTNSENTALGYNALTANTSGFGNTAIGCQTLINNNSGYLNTAIGNDAGNNTTTAYNCTYVGNGATSTITDPSNEIVLGNSSIKMLYCNTTSITGLSDLRDKKNIVSLGGGIEFIDRLNPVSFDWNMRDGGKVDIPDQGFIAQELQRAQQESNCVIPGLVYDNNPAKLGAAYGKLIPIMVQAMKELKKEVDELKKEIDELKNAKS